MRSVALTIVAGSLLASCATRAPEPAPVVPPVVAVDPSSPLAAPTYMAMAASGDLFEIQSSQLALQRSQNPAIRHIAQMLITDHTNMSAQMQAAARAAGLAPPPPMLMPPHTDMMAQLQAAPPGSFDTLYHNLQVAAHQQALALHQNYASGGDHAGLRPVAANAVPIIQTHLQHLQTMTVTAPPPLPPAQPLPGERG